MSISLLFGEMQATAALNNVNARITQGLGRRSTLAGNLKNNSDLMTSQDTVTIGGQTRQVQLTDWGQYHQVKSSITQILNLLINLKHTLLQQLDRYKQMRERDRVSRQNALEGGYGVF